MDKRAMANGLTWRLASERDVDIEIAAPIAAANYPRRGVKPTQRVRISKKNVWRETEAFVDYGVGTIDSLYMTLFGVDVAGYFGGRIPETPDDATAADLSPLAKAIMTGRP